MKFNVFASIALLTVCSLGCDRTGAKKVEVEAPNVKVDVDGKKGVQVDAPGVHVDTAPADGSGVKVDVERAK